MRLHAQKSPDIAEGRAERMRRSRASALALRAAYPSVHQLRVELNFEGASSHAPSAQAHLLYPSACAFFEFPCPHAGCDGEFDLTAVVRHTVSDKTHASRGTMMCSGSRVFDQHSKQPCGLRLNYSVTALL